MALEKPIAFISQDVKTLPFDLQDMRTVGYDRQNLIATLQEPLSKAVGALVHRTDRQFVSWKREQVIQAKGEAVPLNLITDAGDVVPADLGGWTQDFGSVELRLRAFDARLNATYTMRHNDEIHVHGQLVGSGVLVAGRAYISYRIEDKERGQGLYGVLKLIIPQWGNISGFYLAQSYAKGASTVLGRVTLTRTGTAQ